MDEKIIIHQPISLDGVLWAPGRRDEVLSGGFDSGGWICSFSDKPLAAAIRKEMNLPFDHLLRRKAFKIRESYWPNRADFWPAVNQPAKYALSAARTSSIWQPVGFLQGDIAEKAARLKRQPGSSLHCWESANLPRTLLRHQLVDDLWLVLYPLTLGYGKRLFGDGAIPSAFHLTESMVTPSGAIALNCQTTGTGG